MRDGANASTCTVLATQTHSHVAPDTEGPDWPDQPQLSTVGLVGLGPSSTHSLDDPPLREAGGRRTFRAVVNGVDAVGEYHTAADAVLFLGCELLLVLSWYPAPESPQRIAALPVHATRQLSMNASSRSVMTTSVASRSDREEIRDLVRLEVKSETASERGRWRRTVRPRHSVRFSGTPTILQLH